MNIFKGINHLFQVCWNQGIYHGVLLVMGYLSQSRLFPRLFLRFAEKFPPRERSNSSAYLALLKRTPLVSIVMPVYNSRWLKEAADSVLAQSYRHFELILVDDCSTLPETIAVLEQLRNTPQVRIIQNSRNLGISGATNAGIRACAGEFVAFMDHDDLLHPDALACFARTLNGNCAGDVFFTNEVIINSEGTVIGKMRKCSPSLDLLLSCNAVLHFCIVRKDRLFAIGLLNSEYDGAQDHDLMIRAMEHNLSFIHLPFFLYAWRAHRQATSGAVRAFDRRTERELPRAYIAGKKAIQAYLKRHDIRGEVTDDAFFWYRVKYALPPVQSEVAVIIPFKDQPECLRRLMASMDKTSYRNLAIHLVNNRSELPETKKVVEEIVRAKKFKINVVEFNEPFNYSRLHNKVIAGIGNELILLMNNDLEVIEGNWLEAMLEHIYREKVGAVGCRLIRKNGMLQHAGMTFKPDIYYCAMNLSTDEGYFTKVQRDVAGITCACALLRKSVFQQAGGFDEVHFPIGFSDSDLCLRITRLGYKIIYTPFAVLYHHESVTRRVQAEHYEKYALFQRYIGDTPLVDSRYKRGT